MGWTLLGSFALATFFVWLILAKNTLAEPLVFCSILTGSMLALMLECISFLGALTLTNVRVALIGSIIFCSALTFYFRRQVALSDEISTGEHSTTSVPLNSFSCAGASQRDDLSPQSRQGASRVLALILQRLSFPLAGLLLFIVLTATAFTALSRVPNDWDSMTYHLPRIEHWLQNRSLEFYPTSITRQLESNILAEELILTVRSLSGAYPFANIVQWFSFCGCILIVGWITRELGGSRSAQCLSSVIMSTLPMAILQSSNAKNDLVVSFFSVASVYFLLRVRVDRAYSLLYGAVLAAALAFHTKGTAGVYLFGFATVYGGDLAFKARSLRFWRHALAAMVIGLLILGPQLYRNVNEFGSAIGPASQNNLTVEPTWRSTLFNAARNLASNAGTRLVDPWIVWIGRAMHVADTDERYSFNHESFSATPISLSPDEGDAPNTAHVIVLLLSTIGFLAKGSQFRPLARYGLAACISVLAFCVLIKWQGWITRYQLGAFVLVIPLAAVLLSYLMVGSSILMLILGLQAVPAIFHNAARPIFGPRSIISASPDSVLFLERPELQTGYVRLADKIAEIRPKQLGLIFGDDSWEFPLWFLLRERLKASDMPLITHELNEQVTDPRSEVIVYLERRHHAIPGMTEVTGFDPLHLYQRTR
jgi:hypothetical protein